MKLILLTGEECGICDQAKKEFDRQFGREQAHGEASVINIDNDEEWQEKFVVNDLPLAPVVVLVTDEGNIVSVMAPEDLLDYKPDKEEKEPAAAEPDANPLTNPESATKV